MSKYFCFVDDEILNCFIKLARSSINYLSSYVFKLFVAYIINEIFTTFYICNTNCY